MTPLVSIIIPTYRRWDFLFEAVKSVFHQTYKNWDVAYPYSKINIGTKSYIYGQHFLDIQTWLSYTHFQ
jgi:GT2 family glycosyltransferase